jgi:hypothetical protein
MTISRSHPRFRRRKAMSGVPVLQPQLSVQFTAFYTYSPKGESEVSERSRQLCARVKNGGAQCLRSYIAAVHREVADGKRFEGFFGNNTILVPVPRCDPAERNSPWIARRLASGLLQTGLGAEVWDGLRRVNAVRRSSVAWMWERPTVEQHFQSFAVIPLATPPSRILLVDDVITKGRTLMAATLRLREAFPTATINAFALIRTMGLILNVPRLFDPCQGEIRWNGKDVYRDP